MTEDCEFEQRRRLVQLVRQVAREEAWSVMEEHLTSAHTGEGGRSCGQCVHWHKPSCTSPGADYSCVTPTCVFAKDCPDFKPNEEI